MDGAEESNRDLPESESQKTEQAEEEKVAAPKEETTKKEQKTDVVDGKKEEDKKEDKKNEEKDGEGSRPNSASESDAGIGEMICFGVTYIISTIF